LSLLSQAIKTKKGLILPGLFFGWGLGFRDSAIGDCGAFLARELIRTILVLFRWLCKLRPPGPFWKKNRTSRAASEIAAFPRAA
jgi:hypothetical protein